MSKQIPPCPNSDDTTREHPVRVDHVCGAGDACGGHFICGCGRRFSGPLPQRERVEAVTGAERPAGDRELVLDYSKVNGVLR